MGIRHNQSPGDAHKENDDRRAQRDDPIAYEPVAKTRIEISQQRHRTRVSIRTVYVRAQDSVPYEPDRERHTYESDHECGTEDDRLAADSRPVGERVAGAGQQIQQGRTP
jgi:hypothetical protein